MSAEKLGPLVYPADGSRPRRVENIGCLKKGDVFSVGDIKRVAADDPVQVDRNGKLVWHLKTERYFEIESGHDF